MYSGDNPTDNCHLSQQLLLELSLPHTDYNPSLKSLPQFHLGVFAIFQEASMQHDLTQAFQA